MTDPRLNHRAKIVAELVERLGNANADDDSSDFLATELSGATSDLELLCVLSLREARTAEAMAEGVKQIEADNRARRQRLELKSENIRAAVAHAMQEAGLPKIVSDDMTVSLRMGKAPLVIDAKPEAWATTRFVKTEFNFTWNKDLIREELSQGVPIEFARIGNPAPVLTVRGK